MTAYIDLLKKIVKFGNVRADRTGTGTVSLFGPQISYDMRAGFPLPTERRISAAWAIKETLWMLTGSTSNVDLLQQGVTIWDEWAITQQDLEFPVKERLKMLMDKLVRSYGEKEANTKYSELFQNGMKESELEILFSEFNIPKLRPNPNCVKVGALGPIYGEQWVNYPNPLGDKEHIFSMGERIEMAENMLEAGVEGLLYDRQKLEELKGQVDENTDETAIVIAHALLSDWGIAAKETEHSFINQIQDVIDNLMKKPFSRRHVVSTWNVPYLPDESKTPHQNVMDGKMALAPCHTLFQFYVEDREIVDMVNDLGAAHADEFFKYAAELNALDLVTPGRTEEQIRDPQYWMAQFTQHEVKQKLVDKLVGWGIKRKALSLKLYQRSADVVLGVPFNSTGYGALLLMVAQCVDMTADLFVHSFGDAHIYKNHLLPNNDGESVFTMFDRESRPAPTLTITDPTIKNIFDFKYEHFKLEGYDPHPAIQFEVSI